jgi:hypothetical protein
MGRARSMHEEMINTCIILLIKYEGKRPRHRWEDIIKMDLREIGYESVDWVQVF